MINIYDHTGAVKVAVTAESGSKRKWALMGDDYVTLKFVVANPLYISRGDYIDTAFGRFVIVDEQKPTIDTSTGGYSYELKFEALYKAWRNITAMLVYKKTDGATDTIKAYRKETQWNLTADIVTHAGAAIIDNLDVLGITYLGQPYEVVIKDDVSEATKAKSVLITYENVSVHDALTSIANAFDLEWWISGNKIYFGKCQYGDESEAIALEYGNNVSSMGNSKASGTLATRYYVYGSTDNLQKYRKGDRGESVVLGVVTDRLMLPKGIDYIDSYRYDKDGNRVYLGEEGYDADDTTTMPDAEVVETTVTFDDVYPKQELVVFESYVDHYITDEDSDGTKTRCPIFHIRVKDKTTGKVWEFHTKYIIEGQTIQMLFQSGSLNGMTFEAIFNPNNYDTADDKNQQWEIVRSKDYGRYLPDEVLTPNIGDEVVFINFDAQMITDSGLVEKAEQTLYDTAVEYIREQTVDNQTYECKIMCDVAHDGFTMDVGQRVKLINEAYFREPRMSRVIGWEIPFDVPYDNPVYTIGEAVTYSTIGSLASEVEQLTAKGQVREATSGNGIYLIRSNDKTTPASDINAYSALRTLNQFVNAVDDDTVNGLLSFADGMQSVGFVQGMFGNGFELKNKVNDHSYLEIDEIYVRMRAVFEALEIKHVSHVGGENVISPAGIECSRVDLDAVPVDTLVDSNGLTLTSRDRYALSVTGSDTSTKVYRCYFKTTDGERSIVNQFAVGDLAFCKEFNTLIGDDYTTLGRFYWRAVVGVGVDWIDLSITDCQEGSDIPQKGDTIVCMGNKTDTSRQNAIVISSYSADAPSMKMYQGISTYELTDKNAPIIVSPNGNKFTGTFVSTSGESLVDLISGRAKVYTEQPTGLPYKVGDVWVNADYEESVTFDGQTVKVIDYNDEMLVCIKDAKLFNDKYLFAISDWKQANGYTSRIEQTDEKLSLKVYSLGRSVRNFATVPQTATPAINFDCNVPYLEIGKLLTDTLTSGMTLYLTATFDITQNSKYVYPTSLILEIRNGANVLFTQTVVNTTMTGTKQVVLDDVALSVTDDWLVDASGVAVDGLSIVVRANSKISYPSNVVISDFRICNIQDAAYSEASELKLIETGIDIVDRKIKMTADNVEFVNNDGTSSVSIFTDEGKIRASLIDADNVVARRLEAVNSLGTVTIDEGAILLTDKNGKARMRISGNDLTTSTTSESVTMKDYTKVLDTDEGATYLHDKTDLPKDSGYLFSVKSGAVAKFPQINLGASMSAVGDVPQGRIRLQFTVYLDGKVLKTLTAETLAEQQTLSTTALLDSFTLSLTEGDHQITAEAWFWGGDNVITSATYRCEPDGEIAITYPNDMVEIGANGFRAATSGGAYIQQTDEACVMTYQEYQLKVCADGIKVTKDGGNNWTQII